MGKDAMEKKSQATVADLADYRRPGKEEGGAAAWKHIAVILAVILIAYFNSLPNGFVADDMAFVRDNTSIRDTANIPSYFLSPKTLAAADSEWGTIIYRPLRTASYAIDYSLYELRPEGYHVTNMLWHMAACVSLYFLVMALLGIRSAALLSALIFALHPVHVEAVSWIASRADLMGYFLLNLSLLAYIGYTKSPDRKGLLVVSLAFSLLAYLAKETMVSLPGIVIAYDYAARSGKPLKETIRRNLPAWALFTVVCFLYMAFRLYITGRMSTNQGWWGGTAYSNFLMMAKATATYIRLIALPYGFTFHYLIDPVKSVFEPGVLASLAVIAATIGAIVWAHLRNRLVFFLLIWFYLALVPIANIVPISFSMMAERYIYMASAGPIVAAAYGLVLLYRKAARANRAYSTAVGAAIAAGLVVFTVMIIERNRDYADEFAFYRAAVAVSPASAPSNKGLADQYYNMKEHSRAIEYYEKALKIDPGYVEALLGEALVLRETGELGRALALANRAAQVEEAVAGKKPRNALVKFNLGNIYKEMGDIERARMEWEKAVELNPEYSEAYNHLGNYYQMAGDYPRALAMYERSMEINPFNAETNYNAALLYEVGGEVEKAKKHFRLFIKYAGIEYKDVVEDVKKNHL